MMFGTKCPYCGAENEIQVGHDAWIPMDILDCSACSKYFVVSVKKQVILKALKIEGEEVSE